jgi:hypothetical protein
MKNFLTFFCAILFSIILSFDGFAQSFYTGGIGVTQSNGGRTRVFSDNLTTRQIDRISVLVGVSEDLVFDYDQDQGALINAATVGSPLLSDFEVTSTIDNSYSNLPPAIEVAINHYGWTNDAYILTKMNVKNNEATPVNAVIGLEVIPQVDGAYGAETVQWDAASQTVFMNKTNWVGLKFFSGAQTALKSFEWFSGYPSDSAYYAWLTQDSFDAPYTAGVEGAVAILGQNGIPLNPGESVDFYFGIALGSDQSTCTANMVLCQSQYSSIVPVELTSFTADISGTKVLLNWATATELNNLGFEIERRTENSNQWVRVGYKEGYGTTTEAKNYSFVDNIAGISSEKLFYRLKQIDFSGEHTYYGEIEIQNTFTPEDFVLEQNYPNPFNPSTKISFGLPQKSNVVLKVFNTLGQEVAELANGSLEAGTHSYNFDASKLTSGIYVYSLQTDAGVISKKMTLIK